MHPLIWFRSDLRTHDNAALSAATRKADHPVTAVFVVSPAEWKAHDYCPARIDFTLRTLVELAASLQSLNIPLIVATSSRPQDVPQAVLSAAQANGCDSLYYNKEYELNESRRDAATAALFQKHHLAVHSFTDQIIFEPGQIRTGEGRFFTVFTPFKRAWIKHALARGGVDTHPTPKPVKPRPGADAAAAAHPIPQAIPGFHSHVPAENWLAGEAHARKRLAAFAKRRISDYKLNRDFPAIDGTSTLSPYLAIGAISPRQCLAAALRANADSASPFDTGPEGITTWISELIWREFYVTVLVGFPRVSMHRAFQPTTENIRWNENQKHLEAFEQGATGVPIVDAGIRQMLATGWMHNRIRMVVAMYFSKNLFLNWRDGERFFMQNLVDGFLASNNGGWQWSASTGTDAAPYFRIFNPVSQSEKFDAEGTYIRRWVPELSKLSAEAIHAPWELPPLAKLNLNYPPPLVDLGTSRLAAIQAFKKAR